MASNVNADETTGPDTQIVGQLLWAELHENGTQQPTHFEWTPTCESPASSLNPAGAALLQQQPLPSASSRLPTPVTESGFSVPPDLASWRQRLFEFNGGDKITLSLEQWQLYWPFVTNIWTRHAAPYTPKRKQTVRTRWVCRFHKGKPDDSLGNGNRNKNVRKAIGCPAKLTEIHDTLSDRRLYTIDGCHNHLMSDLDSTKINEGIQSWIETQLRQGFSPIAVMGAASGRGKDPSASQNLLDAGGRHLSTKYIINTAQRMNIQVSKPRHVPGKVPVENQAQEALEWLREHHEEWHSAYHETTYKGSPSPGLVFARKRTILTLRERGVLTLMDSTHNTNQGEW